MHLKLYGAPLSPFVRKVRIVMAEKKLDHESDMRVAPLSVPEGYEKIHPLKKIPALEVEDDGRKYIIPDSSSIAAFLEKIRPSPAFYPDDPGDYGRALWLEEYGDTHIAANCTFNIFGNVFFAWARGGDFDPERLKNAFAAMDEVIAYVEELLGERDWLIGDGFSIADLGIVTHFFNVEHAGYRLTEDDSPSLHALKKRIEERPEVAAILAHERKTVEKLGFEAPDLSPYRR